MASNSIIPNGGTSSILVAKKAKKLKGKNRTWEAMKKNYDLYLFLLPALAYFVIFHYGPMYGVQIAFKEFIATKGIWGSEWIGFDNFERFLRSYKFITILTNTLAVSLYSMVFGFLPPIILALLLNQVQHERYKKFVQTVTYAPHFISVVVMVSMLFCFLSPRNGVINIMIQFLGGESINFMGEADWFRFIYIASGIWQDIGWSSIIYIAALAGISSELHEAAIMDGANKLQRMRHIDIPGIMPTAIIMLILKAGGLMNVGFQKVFLMQTPLNLSTSQVISTYVYNVGLINADFSFATAVGLFNSVVNFVLIIIVNNISRKVSETSLW